MESPANKVPCFGDQSRVHQLDLDKSRGKLAQDGSKTAWCGLNRPESKWLPDSLNYEFRPSTPLVLFALALVPRRAVMEVRSLFFQIFFQ